MDEKMNICIGIEKFDPSVGGAERYCWDLVHFLAERGHEVAVICMKAEGHPDPSISVIKVPVLRFPQFLRHMTFALSHFLKAREMTGYNHFCVGNTFFMDVYQPHGGVHRAWFLKETAIHKGLIRTFMRLVRRLSLKDMVQRAMEWWTFTVTRPRVIAISQMVADDMKAFFHYPDELITLVLNGIDLDRFNAGNRVHRDEVRKLYGIGHDEYTFLFVAQNPRLKGYDVLIRACLELRARPFRVLIVGPYDEQMKEMAVPLKGRIIFAGRTKDLHRIYPACDCLAHPTYYDACSLVVLESLASGVPVITTSSNGAAMYIQGQNGRVINPGDPSALAHAMEEMMTSGNTVGASSPLLQDHRTVFTQVEKVMQGHGE